MFFSSDNRHRLVAGIAALSLCAGSLSEVDARRADVESPPSQGPSQMAERLMKRIGVSGNIAHAALDQKKDLLEQSLLVRFTTGKSEDDPSPVRITLASHPDWIVFDAESERFRVDERSIRFFLDDPSHTLFPRVTDAVAYPQEHDELRYRIEGVPKSGYTIEAVSAASTIARAFESRHTMVRVPLTFEKGSVHLVKDGAFSRLTPLSYGVSDFAGSPYGRASNVRKALNEQLQGVVIDAGKSFSYNLAMRDHSGWSDALIIGEGGVLVPEPGGGICQAATTVFRAALLAGLPITERANHSLYVAYYEKHGVGIDATVYAGKQDLTFKNDTTAPVVMLARNDGDLAVVELYGVPDGRAATLDGPYFTGSEEELFAQKPLRINQIGWKHTVTNADGTVTTQPVVSTYKAIPKRLREEYAKQNIVVSANPL